MRREEYQVEKEQEKGKETNTEEKNEEESWELVERRPRDSKEEKIDLR